MSPDEIDENFRPVARTDVAAVELDGEGVLWAEETGEVHVLNPTATVIWACFDGEDTLGELAALLADEFGAPLDTVRTDVFALAQEVAQMGLLEGVEATVDEPADPAAEALREDC